MYRGGGGGGRGRGRGGRGRSRGDKSRAYGRSERKIIISISGFSQRPQLGEIGKLLSSKTKRKIRWTSCKVEQNSVNLEFDNESEARAILRLKDLDFKGQKLKVTSQSNFKLRPEQQASLLQFIGESYDPSQKYLDLSRASSKLRNLRADFNDRGFMDCICTIISENCPDVLTIRFDFNEISSLSSFDGLSEAAPSLINLSLANNALADFNELVFLSGYSSQLRELMLANNRFPTVPKPIYDHMVKRNLKSLILLDQIPIQEIIEFAVPQRESLLPETRPSSFDPPETEALARQVVMKYFELFDSNRDGLLAFYHEQSHFSCAVEGSSLTDYVQHSRNLLRLTGWGQRNALLKTGKIEIISMLRNLPASQHLPHTFAADVSGFGSHVLICVAGQLVQPNTTGNQQQSMLDFHRAFLLLRIPNGGCLIVNDHLQVSPGSSAAAAALPTSASPVLTDAQQQVVMQLARQANCTPDLAFQAFTSFNGDANQALQALQRR